MADTEYMWAPLSLWAGCEVPPSGRWFVVRCHHQGGGSGGLRSCSAWTHSFSEVCRDTPHNPERLRRQADAPSSPPLSEPPGSGDFLELTLSSHCSTVISLRGILGHSLNRWLGDNWHDFVRLKTFEYDQAFPLNVST